MSKVSTDEPGYEGFAGTVPAFLDWLKGRLVYGGIRISEPVPAVLDEKKSVRRVELVTAGFSDDEHLLGRVERGSVFALMFWSSTHRGGLTRYEVPLQRFDSTEEVTWLEPATDVFEEVHRARYVVVRTSASDEFSVAVRHGARLSFSEPKRDINEPAGLLVVEAIGPDGP